MNSFFKFFSNIIFRQFLSAYSYFFTRFRRIQGKCLSVYGEYGVFRVLCGTQNRLRYVTRSYTYMEKTPKDTKLCFISAYNPTNFKCFKIISIYTIWDGLSLKTISRYCPFKWIVHMWNILNLYLSILPWDLSSYSLPYSSRIHSNFARGSSFWLSRNLSNHMDRQARTRDTELDFLKSYGG